VRTAYLSLGSNLDDRESNLRRALQMLASPDLHVKRVSSLYETEPQDLRRQPWFLNLVAEVETALFPIQLLHRIQKIEKELGRKRIVEKGPRIIDIDIVFFGNFVIHTPLLEIPHPRMQDRRFVLEPMAELAPDLRHPVTRRSLREMLAGTAGQIVRKLTD
jgi:2-amino-4-hydroxy-6-hydroxymethyldihydropteridine diphosphokinase